MRLHLVLLPILSLLSIQARGMTTQCNIISCCFVRLCYYLTRTASIPRGLVFVAWWIAALPFFFFHLLIINVITGSSSSYPLLPY